MCVYDIDLSWCELYKVLQLISSFITDGLYMLTERYWKVTISGI